MLDVFLPTCFIEAVVLDVVAGSLVKECGDIGDNLPQADNWTTGIQFEENNSSEMLGKCIEIGWISTVLARTHTICPWTLALPELMKTKGIELLCPKTQETQLQKVDMNLIRTTFSAFQYTIL